MKRVLFCVLAVAATVMSKSDVVAQRIQRATVRTTTQAPKQTPAQPSEPTPRQNPAAGETVIKEGLRTGVKIGEVVWATRNVGEPGKFVENPWDYGRLYTFFEAMLVCPQGWRVPTVHEIIREGEWTTVFGVSGTAVRAVNEVIFLPAAGYEIDGGTNGEKGIVSRYWTGSDYPNDKNRAFYMQYPPSRSAVVYGRPEGGGKNDKYSVRCVAK